MHHIYQTPGFILKSIPTGEANRQFFILTKDLGVIRATAQGVRLLKSKLRFKLTNFMPVKVSLVRGKEIWRIVGVERDEEIPFSFLSDNSAKIFVAKIFSLILRLSQGEEKNEALYDMVREAFIYTGNESDSKKLESLELVLGLRILKHLGYLRNLPQYCFLGEDNCVNESIVCEAEKCRRQIIEEINRTLQETHL
jgi:DNA repair protein RecO